MWVLKVKVISLPYIFQVWNVLCFTRPRYQVSVYRTIEPLVLNIDKEIESFQGRSDSVPCISADRLTKMDKQCIIQKHSS